MDTIILTTTDYVPGYEVTEILGLAQGSCVQTKSFGKDFGAGLKTLVGGEVRAYTDMMNESRQLATKRMVDKGNELYADAIINIRYSSAAVMQGAAEIMVVGTAVRLRKIQ